MPNSSLRKFQAVVFVPIQQGPLIYDQIFEDNLEVQQMNAEAYSVLSDTPVPFRVTQNSRNYDILEDLLCPELSTIDKVLLMEITELIDDLVGIELELLEMVLVIDAAGTVVILYEEEKVNGTK